jgi:haloacetate dehalogenase
MFRSPRIGHHDVLAALDRRGMLKAMTAVVGGAAAAGFSPAVVGGATAADASPRPQGDPNTTRFFPGFKTFRVPGAGAEIHGVIGGQGPPLLLLHGAPQTHVSWSLVAPRLAAEYTVVAADLRGYGDSSKPPDGESHVNYSKRAMGLDQVEVMRHFGFERFALVGHDRGARVGHRMALDHPDRITRLAVIDIIPTYYVYTHVTLEIIQAYYTWFSNARRAPVPEEELKSSYEVRRSRATSEIQLEYLRTASDPANIHAMCEDYRAAASIDLKHEEADRSKKVLCPLLALWGERSPNTQPHDVLGLWRDRAIKVTGRAMPSGHDVQIDAPDLFVAELRAFLKA